MEQRVYILRAVLLLATLIGLFTAIHSEELTHAISSSDEVSTNDAWKKPEFFIDVVAKDTGHLADTFKVQNLLVTNATGSTSTIHRVTLDVELQDGEHKSFTYIVKEKLDNVNAIEMVDKLSGFLKEIELYEKFLPAFEDMLDTQDRFGPRIFKHTTSPFSLIVMEDLNASGFDKKDIIQRLDLSYSKRFLTKLAMLHAASAVYYEKNGPYPELFNGGMFSENRSDSIEEFYQLMYASYVTTLAERNYSSHILEVIRQWGDNPYLVGSKLFRFRPDDFNVLNHGDIWLNHVMFGEKDVRMIGFQSAFFGSPAFDILVSILCLVDVDTIILSFDDLIEHYHLQLVDSLKMLNYTKEMPSIDQLKIDINKRGFLTALLSFEIIPVDFYNAAHDLRMDLIKLDEPEGEALRRKLFTEQTYVTAIDKLLPFLYDRGFLNVA